MDPVSISLRKRAGGVVGQKFQSQDSSVESIPHLEQILRLIGRWDFSSRFRHVCYEYLKLRFILCVACSNLSTVLWRS